MRVIVSASRSWTKPQPIRDRLDQLVDELPHKHVLFLIYGDARGGDTIIHQWVLDHTSVWIRGQRYTADWETHGKAAGIVRNIEMVDSGGELCIGFLRPCANPKCTRPQPHYTHGTTHCLDYARKKGIRVEEFRWDEQ
jgi:hypothetical protein